MSQPKQVTLLATALFAASCSESSSKIPADVQAWRECQFELDKVEAIRGRNLDDMNGAASVARNQFLSDCMSAKAQIPSLEMSNEMMEYVKSGPNRSERSTSLNDGKDRL